MVNLRAGLRRLRSRPVAMGKAVVGQVRENDVPFMAGSIAYQAFVSLFPLLLLLFLAVAAVGDEALARRVIQLTRGYLPDAAQQVLRNTIVGTEGSAGVSIIGLVTVVWGALKIFRGLDKAFSDIYETDEENSFLDQLTDGLVVLPAIAVSILAFAGATTLFAILPIPFVGLLNPLLLVAGLTAAFLPMYRRFPDVDLSWREAVPGALFAGVGWTVLQSLFQVYIAVSGNADASSIVGGIILLLTWLYFSGLVLLLGAVVNAVIVGETSASPVAEGGPADPTADPSDRIAHLEAERERVRDRLADVRAERDRLSRKLDRESSLEPAPPAEVTAIRRENRLLRRRLRWLEKPAPVRAALRLFGASPPPQVEPADAAGRRGADAEGRASGGTEAD